MTTREALAEFLTEAHSDVEHGVRAPSTIKEYERLITQVVALPLPSGGTLGDVAYVELDRIRVTQALMQFARSQVQASPGSGQRSKKKRPSPTSVNRAKAALASGFKFVDTSHGIDRPNPGRGITLRDVTGRANKPEREKRFLTPEQMDAMVEQCTDAHRHLLRVICETGLRSAEARGLRLEDVHLGPPIPYLEVTGQADEHGGRVERVKSESSAREVPLTPKAVEAIKTQLAENRLRKIESEFVFPTQAGTTHSNTNVSRSLVKAVRRAGIVGSYGLHDLRHSFAMAAIGRAVPINVLSQALGHADVATTAKVYLASKLSLEEKAAALL